MPILLKIIIIIISPKSIRIDLGFRYAQNIAIRSSGNWHVHDVKLYSVATRTATNVSN